jgi:hypothetical protein
MKMLFAGLIATLKRELAEDRGEVPASSRPACPKCQRPLVAWWGRHARRFRINCPNTNCVAWLHDFATGATEDEAWARLSDA